MKIIGTGLSGFLGSRVIQLTSDRFYFDNLSLETGIDITNKSLLEERIRSSDAPWFFHFAARTDVDGAESERSLGASGPTWVVNVGATSHVVEVCAKTQKKMLFISTDYVFDGTKDVYAEEDVPNPQGWYAKTKHEGEKSVLTLGDRGLIIRIANPYGDFEFPKKDFVHRIIEKIQRGDTITSPSDQLFVPTFIDDIVHAIVQLVEASASGIYHVVGSQVLSPYEAAVKIGKLLGYDSRFIEPTTFKEYFANRSPRPFHAYLLNDKIRKRGISMSTFDEGLVKVVSSLPSPQ